MEGGCESVRVGRGEKRREGWREGGGEREGGREGNVVYYLLKDLTMIHCHK